MCIRDRPISGQLIQELFHYEGLANYFEVGQAIQDLTEQGNIRPADGDADAYEITDAGCAIVETLQRDLPVTVREKAVKSAIKLLTRLRRERENKVEIKMCIRDSNNISLFRCFCCSINFKSLSLCFRP